MTKPIDLPPHSRIALPTRSLLQGVEYTNAGSTDIRNRLQAEFRKNTTNLIGQRFGTLRVTANGGTAAQKQRWVVTCDCGAVRTVRAASLLSGNTKSCGCASKRTTTHGRSHNDRTYRIWSNMKSRGSGLISKENYFDKGIRVCAHWRDSFENFVEDMGDAPADRSLDRIDNARGYEPGNCRWATLSEQARNKRNNRFIEAFGERRCMEDWRALLGVSHAMLFRRLASGQTIEQLKAEVDLKLAKPANVEQIRRNK